uniref:ATP-dependent Clp protease proteolytic subunit n=1 Tax=Leptobrachium leishanense TaxID=445787 RepID=A0A8C5QVA3_9ANUR
MQYILSACGAGSQHGVPPRRQDQRDATLSAKLQNHDPPAGQRTRDQATDIAIQAEEILKLKKQINEIYAKHTQQDRYMSPTEAQEFGILDKVLVHLPQDGEDEPELITKHDGQSPPTAGSTLGSI